MKHHEPCIWKPVRNTKGEWVSDKVEGRHLYLEVDLTGTKEQILEDVGFIVDMYRDFMKDKPKNRNQPHSLDIWFIYDWV